MVGNCVYHGNEKSNHWCAKYARNMVCTPWCPHYKPRVRRCVDCVHGPQAYDVKRRCPVLKRVVSETDEACDDFEDRNLAAAYMRPPIDPCGERGK